MDERLHYQMYSAGTGGSGESVCFMDSLVPQACALAGRKEPGILCLRMLWIWKLPENLLRYTNLHEARQLLPYKRCLPLTTLSADDEEGATKVLSSSLARVVHVLVHSS